MSAELELSAWDINGRKLWSKNVEPPWSYEIRGDRVELDVMGKAVELRCHNRSAIAWTGVMRIVQSADSSAHPAHQCCQHSWGCGQFHLTTVAGWVSLRNLPGTRSKKLRDAIWKT
jgi:hypothetical protein